MNRLGSRSSGGHGFVEDSSCEAGRFLWKKRRRFFDSETDARVRLYERDLPSMQTGPFTAPASSELVCGAAPADPWPRLHRARLREACARPGRVHRYLARDWHPVCRPARLGHNRRRDWGGSMILLGAFVPVATVPMIVVLLVATFTVHVSNGFSSIKLLSYDAMVAHFGQPGYETDLLYRQSLSGANGHKVNNGFTLGYEYSFHLGP